MALTIKEIGDEKRKVWITQPREINDTILKRREQAFHIAMGKLKEHNNPETVMQTAEAFGRGLFSDFIQEKPTRWTMEEWIKPVVEKIFNPMGTAATFTKITEEEAKSVVFRCPIQQKSKEACSHCSFSYGFVRGLFRSAFPNGEVVMGNIMVDGAPMCEFTFKTNPTDEYDMERERVKQLFTKQNMDEK